MTRQYVYGGMATATALALGIGMYGLLDRHLPTNVSSTGRSVASKPESTTALASRTANEMKDVIARLESNSPSRDERLSVVGGSPNTPATAPPKPTQLRDSLSKNRELRGARGLVDSLGRSQAQAVSAQQSASVPRPAEKAPLQRFEVTGRDQFANVEQNIVKRVADEPVSTFSIDVDTVSYTFVRRMLNRGVLPQKNSVRIEELVNYFHYDFSVPATRERPFQPTVTVTASPWKKGNKLIHIGIKGYNLEPADKPRSNLVFLLDVSGSMRARDKLPLVINSMKLLLGSLKPADTVAIVVYAGSAGTVLEPTKVAEKHKILAALDRLQAGGSTAGAAGIRQAYALAEGTFDKKAVNRVILATDGDFNIGITNRDELKGFVERKRKSGVFLSVLGFGQGNLNDRLMQTLAQNGNGVAAHIDTLNEAQKVLVNEASSTLFPIAKDVKIQVEFNPKTVAEYRLIGYETRALRRQDFNNDNVDAGDVGAGHTVTAIYEITPVGGDRMIGKSRYPKVQETDRASATSAFSSEYGFLKIRYKLPDANTSRLISTPITASNDVSSSGGAAAVRRVREANWATAVAAFGQILKGGNYTGSFSYDDVIALALTAKGDDAFGYRAEFINLVRLARSAAVLPKK